MNVEITIAQLLSGIWVHEEPLPEALSMSVVRGVSLDNRTLQDGHVFIAVPGEASDGRDYIAQCSAGIVAVIAESDEFVVESVLVKGGAEKMRIGIPHLKKKVSALAANFYGHPSKGLTVLGITGTNGKTTCAYLLAQLLSKLEFSCAMLGTLGYGIFDDEGELPALTSTGLTTPSAVDCQKILASLKGHAGAVAMEVSSHAIDQGRVEDIDFDGAVFTNLSRDHLDYHGTLEEYAGAKAKLFSREELSFVVVNEDDPVGRSILKDSCAPQAQLFSYSIVEDGSEIARSGHPRIQRVLAHSVRVSAEGTKALLATPWGNASIATPLVGRYNLSNVLAVMTCACALGYKLEQVLEAVQGLRAAPGRLQRINVEAPVNVFVDYAHTPDALEKVLSEVASYTQGQLWVVVGCGGNRDKGKRPLMASAAERYAQKLIFTSDNPRDENPENILQDMQAGVVCKDAMTVEPDRKAAIQFAVENALAGDSVVIAGKGHEDYQLIKGEKISFNDALVAKSCLEGKYFAHMRGQAL